MKEQKTVTVTQTVTYTFVGDEEMVDAGVEGMLSTESKDDVINEMEKMRRLMNSKFAKEDVDVKVTKIDVDISK